MNPSEKSESTGRRRVGGVQGLRAWSQRSQSVNPNGKRYSS